MKRILGIVLTMAVLLGTMTGFAEERNSKWKNQKEDQKQEQLKDVSDDKEKPTENSKEQIADKIARLEKQLIDLKEKYEQAGTDATVKEKVLKDVAKMKKDKGDKSIDVYVAGKHMKFDSAPFIIDGRTFVPIRAVSQALKAEVDWNADTKTVTITKTVLDKKDATVAPKVLVITLQSGNLTATVNGVDTKIDATPMNINGRIFVPIRFIAATMRSLVKWDQDSGSVIIDDEDTTTPEPTATPEASATPEVSATPGASATPTPVQ